MAYRRVLVPLDGSELAERAIPYAKTIALNTGSELMLFTVIPTSSEKWRSRYNRLCSSAHPCLSSLQPKYFRLAYPSSAIYIMLVPQLLLLCLCQAWTLFSGCHLPTGCAPASRPSPAYLSLPNRQLRLEGQILHHYP